MHSSTQTTVDFAERGMETTLQVPAADALESGCFHCGTPLHGAVFTSQEKFFCCQGCLTVFELLTENGLADFYRFGKAAGVRAKTVPTKEDFSYLDDPALRQRLVDFADERETRVTFEFQRCIALLASGCWRIYFG
jgi:P-type Cu+ transporter